MNHNQILTHLWKLGCFPSYQTFQKNKNHVSQVQSQILKDILRLSEQTEFGKKFKVRANWNIKEFQNRIPVSEYTDYEEFLNRMIQGKYSVLSNSKLKKMGMSSGSSGKHKWVPFTEKLAKEYAKSISVWIYGLFQSQPEIKKGKFYFSVSPSEFPTFEESKVPIGFDEDRDYLNPIERMFAKSLLVVPENISQIPDTNFVLYITCLYLLNSKDLSFVSIWHPSFWMSILDRIQKDHIQILADLENGTISEPIQMSQPKEEFSKRYSQKNPKRSQELRGMLSSKEIHWSDVWPNLKLISCWTDSFAKESYLQVKELFPNVPFESKGILATEAAITIPFYENRFNTKHLLAYTSHFFEFMDPNGNIFLPEELEIGQEYEVLVTTGGGFYRYLLGDRFEMVSRYGQIPELRFLGRNDEVSDLVGEKLNENFLRVRWKPILTKFHLPERETFLRGNLSEKTAYYELVTTTALTNSQIKSLTDSLELVLHENPHYAYARRLGQLRPVQFKHVVKEKGIQGRLSTSKMKILRAPIRKEIPKRM
ncbi:hypothetical protein EHQ59_05700 [Leptospira kemamanensis]|uniref:GH3 middle domain-containing protein n=1 Tax=Leptospira kemamanensis TaxID=2484942 RepID=A0A4R9JSN8_9LEPT|nr:GH3 auxin-responsive promoter family protein [Leptospira kemamanensis]TGL55101.1 hypothetical protein EHQ59_05700 [Leptospira kemamanensis]